MPSSHLLYLFLIFFFPVWACCNGGAWRRCTSDGELSTGCLLIWSCCKVDWAEDAATAGIDGAGQLGLGTAGAWPSPPWSSSARSAVLPNPSLYSEFHALKPTAEHLCSAQRNRAPFTFSREFPHSPATVAKPNSDHHQSPLLTPS
ncbi:hypothetical protein M0R45_030373 [Rubus argutus]|uniref:Secreted protein n=1 Tax=Rubus argutus TaxID=59490 RepID=A0AAW1WAT5_RUBAR